MNMGDDMDMSKSTNKIVLVMMDKNSEENWNIEDEKYRQLMVVVD
jgi:hypothetical protein